MSPEAVICVVDDDDEVRESIGTFFRSAGVNVAKFGNAEDLLAWPNLFAMRCLITDLTMPGMDGLELQRELRRRGSEVPVILMTAFPTPEARERAEAQGVPFFVAKPTDPETLLDKVEALLG
ncbi:response regulator [Rhizobium laguerreae]|uniref:response regulator transcription factor n=1 Tax=Rhizobium laguerreae TaxID=1076926 RepID=UPI001C90727C|nr:response regulator [Rhizobium laguerreae]MBY3088884.1 response regulator [Rhizobium laguerreae]MBY3150592.1 response regulator [Rhizobium laguerreae]